MTVYDATVSNRVIGHQWALDLISANASLDHTAQAYLFCGPPRIGKTTLALHLARTLNCTAADHRPCGTCSACRRIERNGFPDVRVWDATNARIRIDEIREIQQDLALSPFEGSWKVHILCGFHRATPEASNCLLKTLEEPPRRAVIILTAADCESLLPTIVSRCQIFQLRPLELAHVEQALQQHWKVEPSRALMLARLSEGRIGWAIEASQNEALLQNREKYLLALEQALQQGVVGRMGLAQQLGQTPQTVAEMLELWQVWWRDALMAKCGLDHLVSSIDRQDTIRAESRHYSLHEIVSCLQSIQRANQHVEQNVSASLALEALFLAFPRPAIQGG